MSRKTGRRRRNSEAAQPSPLAKPSPTWQAWGIPLFVGLATFVAFLPALRNGFVAWDDQANFLENAHYRGLRLENLRWMWTTFLLGHYVPLSWMTLGLDYVIWGMNPMGYHLTSMVIHSANAVLMYFLARRVLLLGDSRSADGTALGITAGFAALVFSIHPLRVESVAWATERRDVLSAFFYLSSLLCYLRFAVGENHRRWYGWAIASFVCALLSKGTSVTLPVVLLVLNVYPLRRLELDLKSPSVRRVGAELLPFIALSGAFVVMTFVALQKMPQLAIPQKVAVSAYSLMFYLWKSVAPAGLAPLYDLPEEIRATQGLYLACYAMVIALTIGAWAARKKHPGLTTAWALFVLILFPLLGVHQNGPQVAADRYTYNAAPVLAIFLAGTWLSLRRPMSPALITLAASCVAILGVLTWRQSQIWRDSVTMWSSVLRINERSSVTLTALGNLEAEGGKPDSAAHYYLRSLAIDPYSAEAENNLGIALSHLGQRREAIPHFERAFQIKPDDYEAHNNMGLAIADLGGDPEVAIAHYRKALEINPKYADAHVNWGNALVVQGKIGEAIPHYERAAALDPLSADAERNWGVALARQEKFGEAILHFQRALDLKPGYSDVEMLLRKATELQRGRGGGPGRL
jgi:tetratricopeptide (TPR) repeat protein